MSSSPSPHPSPSEGEGASVIPLPVGAGEGGRTSSDNFTVAALRHGARAGCARHGVATPTMGGCLRRRFGMRFTSSGVLWFANLNPRGSCRDLNRFLGKIKNISMRAYNRVRKQRALLRGIRL